MNIYLLIQTTWNGSVPLSSIYSAYPNRHLAEAVMNKLKSVNKNIREYDITYCIEEIDYYSQLKEVPIMKR